MKKIGACLSPANQVKFAKLLQVIGVFALACTAGCATTEPTIQVRTVNVAVPVPCREPVPAKPAWPTDSLPATPTLDGFVAAAIAEIELREGYATQLETALRACVSEPKS